MEWRVSAPLRSDRSRPAEREAQGTRSAAEGAAVKLLRAYPHPCRSIVDARRFNSQTFGGRSQWRACTQAARLWVGLLARLCGAEQRRTAGAVRHRRTGEDLSLIHI